MSEAGHGDTERYLEFILGRAPDQRPAGYDAYRCHDLFDGFGPDARGLGSRRPAEIAQLLAARPYKLQFPTAGQLAGIGEAGLEVVQRHGEKAADRYRTRVGVAQQLYRRVAEGDGTEYGFRHGRDLAVAMRYEPADMDATPGPTLQAFHGLANPWLLSRPRPGERCVDAGCGTGMDALVAARAVGVGGRVLAVDITWDMVNRVRVSAIQAGMSWLTVAQAPIEHLPVADGWADGVSANGVLVVLRDPMAALMECRRVLRPGGRLRLADVLYGNDDETVPPPESDLAAWNRLGTARPRKFEMQAMLVESGFTDVRFGPALDPYLDEFDHDQVWGHTIEAEAAP